MIRINRRAFLLSATAAATAVAAGCHDGGTDGNYECPPCGCAMDGVGFDAPGICPACNMTLQPTRDVDLGLEPAQLILGAGHFRVAGGLGREQDRVTVHFYQPSSFTSTSTILLVVPGSSRHSADARNNWLEIADRTGTLVASLGYPEESYDFAAYQLAGVAASVSRQNATIEHRQHATVIRMRDEDLDLELNRDKRRWLFNDFDRIFEILRSASGSKKEGYSLFGHSAGGQVLHRMALLHPDSQAEQIIASNAGFYTLPDLSLPFPLGLANTGMTDASLAAALQVPLTLLLGELDNSDDAGGTLLHTPAVDQQGLGRRDRGRSFYEAGLAAARELGVTCAWHHKVVPGVGHSGRQMAEFAAVSGELLLNTPV